MKGFPNQIADLAKLAAGMRVLTGLVDANKDATDDAVFGTALVEAGVAGTGHVPKPIDEYLREQRAKTPANQSFRTTARGLRELFRLLRLTDETTGELNVTPSGRQAAGFEGADLTPEQMDFWRTTIRNMTHDGGDGEISHPYQVLLRLVARRPGITRAKCALALEARDDSAAELDRIAALSDLDEEQILRRVGVSKANWDNAKKVLPRFAEQLNDVVRASQTYVLASEPGAGKPADEKERGKKPGAPKAPRTSRKVTSRSIGRAGTDENFDEGKIPLDLDPLAAAAAIALRRERLRRHNLIVKGVAERLEAKGAGLYEDPFDILAIAGKSTFLFEMKTLDGSPADERDRVMEALSQLLYYEAFVTAPYTEGTPIYKVACFESRVTAEHQVWLNGAGIGTMWVDGDAFSSDELARNSLEGLIDGV